MILDNSAKTGKVGGIILKKKIKEYKNPIQRIKNCS